MNPYPEFSTKNHISLHVYPLYTRVVILNVTLYIIESWWKVLGAKTKISNLDAKN